jgi:hypothetical protein
MRNLSLYYRGESVMTINEIIDWHIEQASECRQIDEIPTRNFHLDIATTLIWQTKWDDDDLRSAMCSQVISLKEATL